MPASFRPSRLLPLAVLATLVVAVQFLLPRPDPVRLAALRCGSLLREPAEIVDGENWRSKLAGGDRVGLADGSEAEVRSLEDGVVEVAPSDGSALIELAAVDLTELVEKRPLWRYLTEAPAAYEDDKGTTVVRVRGYRMVLGGTVYDDPRLHARVFESIQRAFRSIAAEEGFSIDFDQDLRKHAPGVLFLADNDNERMTLEAKRADGTVLRASVEWTPPTGVSVLPPLVAILLAMLLRRPLIALASGVFVGAVIERTAAGATVLGGVGSGGGRVITRYFGGELVEPTRLQIVLFLVFMMAMVGVVTRAGGIRGLMERVARLAGNARRSQVAIAFMGLVVFFDHYANTILVGSTMRPLTDRFKVAREKLAYLVDSTAAPVAGLSLFSTWIAFEVSTFSVQLPEAGMAASQGYEVFLRTMPFRFYSLFTLFFVGLVVFTGRDFGPMLRAERRARGGDVLREGARPLVSKAATRLQPAPGIAPRARLALVPLATFVVTTLLAILVRGGAFAPVAEGAAGRFGFEGITAVMYRGSGSAPLMVGALAGLLVAAALAASVGLRREILTGAWSGFRSMGVALGMLYLAWMIGAVCRDLDTATYLSVLLQDSLNPLILPLILFGISSLMAFSTGSSWSTMTILLPLVVGISYEAGQAVSIGGEAMLIIAIGSVLEGAIFGDHCSPLSDTTVMSSIASASDHVDHVRTQAPYAILAMVVALVCGYCPAVIMGLSPFLSLLIGAAVLTVFMFVYGKKAVGASEPDVREADVGGAAELSRDAA